MSLQTETRRIYVRPLASYVAGDLYGEWINVDGMSGDELAEAVAEVLANGPAKDADEWAVHDCEGFGPIKLGEHPDLDTVAEVAEALDEHGEAYAVWYANESRDGADVDGFREDYQGTFDNLEGWAENWLEDTGALKEVPSSLRSYIDFASWARDAEMGVDIWSEHGSEGCHVFTNR